MLRKLFLIPCGVSLLLAGCNNGASTTGNSAGGATNTAGSGAGDAKKMTIAVIPKGTTHSYWKSVQAGANKAGEEFGVNIVFKGPVKESDRAGQIQIMQQFISQGTSAIVLAPLDDSALVKPVKTAFDKKIPVVIIDSAIKSKPGTDYASFVATNNYQGGVLAGERMVKLLNGKGKVAMMRYMEGSASTADREGGFMSVMKKNPGITMTVDNRYGGATMGEAKSAALDMVDFLKASDGVFAPNESSAQGMMLALRQLRLNGKIKFVGFDASAPLLDGLRNNDIAALVVQNPTKMGYEGVKAAVAALKGEKVAATIDTGVAVVDKANLNSAATKEVLNENS